MRWLEAALALAVSMSGCGDAAQGPGDGDATGDAPDTSPDIVPDTADTADLGDTAVDADDTAVDANDTVAPQDTRDASDLSDAPDTASPDVEPRCGDGHRDPDEACDDGDLDDLDGCDRACALAPTVPPPTAGDVLLNELMIDPAAVSDRRGEWLELVNLTATRLNLSGCELRDDGTDRVPLSRPGGLALDLSALFVLGANGDKAQNGKVTVDFVYTTMLLDDRTDAVALVCDGVVIDRVAWTPYTWPIIGGRALARDPSRRFAAASADLTAWCAATTVYGAGDRGTPGQPNPTCPQLDRSIDACRLVSAPVVTDFVDHPIDFRVEVEERGLTDLTSGVDLSPELVVEIGLAPASDTPTYTWSRALPLAGYVAAPGSATDPWVGAVASTEVGDYRVLARASRDGGLTYALCDPQGLTATPTPVHLMLGPTPCAAVSCDAPPAPTCTPDQVHVAGAATPGTCVPLSGPPLGTRCDYTGELIDCGRLGRRCEEDPALGAVCASVPRGPQPDELVLSELLVHPSSTLGAWFELTSLADEPLLLTGCTFTVTDASSPETPTAWTLLEPTVIGRRAALVLGQSLDPSANGGAPIDRAFDEALVLPAAGTLAVDCDGLGDPEDSVSWDATWPLQAGGAASLSPFRFDAASNDTSDAWCRSALAFGDGDRGTPGAPNPSCPGDLVPVEVCRVAGPAVLAPPAGTLAEVSVRLIARALTGKTVKTDPSARIRVETALVVRGASPSTAATWTPAQPDTSWSAVGAGVDAAEDRYRGVFTVPAPGAWDLYVRATADGGNSWSYGDLAGLLVPSSVGQPTRVDPVASACGGAPCAILPAPRCESGTARIIAAEAPATCTLGAASEAVCTFVERVATDCAALGATCRDGVCVDFPRPPAPGELAFSELMIAPGTNELGEWLELTNVSPDTLDLRGCVLESDGPSSIEGAQPESFPFPPPPSSLAYVVGRGAAVTLARSPTVSVNGGVSPLAAMTSIALDNRADRVELFCPDADGVLRAIDRVVWDADDDWLVPVGTSIQLSGAWLDAAAAVTNDLADAYCAPGLPTPRVANLVCPGDRLLDDCRLEAVPAAIGADLPLAYAVRLFDPGVTDLRPGPDVATGTLVSVGLGPASENPRSSLAWTWTELDADPLWEDASDPEAPLWDGWDRWAGASIPTLVGNLRVLGRVSLDGGQTQVFCGPAGLATTAVDGASVNVAPGVCAPNPCTQPPAATCSGATLTGRLPIGTCPSDGLAASCQYPTQVFSCATYGGCNAATAGCNLGPARPSVAGQVIFTEVMRDSVLPAPDLGEWVEVKNTDAVPLDLRDCELVNARGDRTVIRRGVPEVLAPSGHMVFAHRASSSENGGIPLNNGTPRSLGDLVLGNGGDTLSLVCGGVEIDRVTWGWDWPGSVGIAMQLDRNKASGAQNDLRASWCAATPVYGGLGQRGSPGTLNLACP
ncbi:MAG: lamin tail domain-containing protein [Deltaproteobacteria bacterium]|nr:lamin tail domain-containing protein [Deltaproteobacteria bacterium]